MRNKVIISSLIFIAVGLLVANIISYSPAGNNTVQEVSLNNSITFLYETAVGSKEYKESFEKWQEGYQYNRDLSYCEFGSELVWDDTKKAVFMAMNSADNCYVYFDKV